MNLCLCAVIRGKINIMTNNSFLIHIESGDIFYNDFNTKENFYIFLIAQQDETKQFNPKRTSYHHSFEKYTRNYLPSCSLEEIDKSYMISHKNSKYLWYKFYDWIKSLGAKKILIRHTLKVKNEV